MKKKLAGTGILAAIVLITTWCIRQTNPQIQLSDLDADNIEALANPQVLCPNGCTDDGNGCYCHGWYPTYKEYRE